MEVTKLLAADDLLAIVDFELDDVLDFKVEPVNVVDFEAVEEDDEPELPEVRSFFIVSTNATPPTMLVNDCTASHIMTPPKLG